MDDANFCWDADLLLAPSCPGCSTAQGSAVLELRLGATILRPQREHLHSKCSKSTRAYDIFAPMHPSIFTVQGYSTFSEKSKKIPPRKSIKVKFHSKPMAPEPPPTNESEQSLMHSAGAQAAPYALPEGISHIKES